MAHVDEVAKVALAGSAFAAAVARHPGPPGTPSGPARGRDDRPARRRRRLHRAVDGAARRRARPGPRRGAHRGRPDRGARHRPQRRVLRGEPHPRRGQRPDAAGPTSTTSSTGWASRTSTRSRRPSRATGSTAGSSATGRYAVATREHEVAALEPDGRGLPRRGRDARRMVASPTYLAGRHEPDTCALVDPARLAWGLARGRGAAGRPDPRAHPPDRPRADRQHGVEAATTARHGRGRAASPWPPTSSAAPLRRGRWSVVPVYDYVLATEPLTDAQLDAIRWDPSDRHLGLGQPVPLLPGHPRPPDPVGRLRRDLPLRALDRGPTTTTGRRPSRRWRGTSPRPSRSSTGSGSPTAGRASSTPRPGSARSTAPATAAARRTPPGSPASASGRRGSPPT